MGCSCGNTYSNCNCECENITLPIGPTGATGSTGPTGHAGSGGSKGTAGADGADGADGQDTIYSVLTSEAVVIPATSLGVAILTVKPATTFKLYIGSTEILVSAIAVTCAMSDPGITVAVTQSGNYAVITIQTYTATLKYGYIDVRYTYLGITYTNRYDIALSYAGTNGTNGINGMPTTVSDTDTIDLTLAGTALSADVKKQMSITSDASGIKLSGDVAAPGNYYYYGTSSIGTKGWYQSNPYTDSGWVDLLGFGFYGTGPTPSSIPVEKPQYRVLGRTIYFKGMVVIPLDDGAGAIVPYSSIGTDLTEKTYADTSLVAPNIVAANGVTILGTNEGLSFNLGAPVMAVLPDHTYSTRVLIAQRRVKATPVGQAVGAYIVYSAPVSVTISSGGVLSLATILDSENCVFGAASTYGTDPLRLVSSSCASGEYALDYQTITGGHLHSIVAGAALTLEVPYNTSYQHSVTIDGANASKLGGFSFQLDGLIAHI